MKAFIRSASCISPQPTFSNGLFGSDAAVVHNANYLEVMEPAYTNLLDPKLMRRMSKIVRIGTATAMACLQQAGVANADAIVAGTAYGCLEDSENFLKKIVLQDEQMLSPTAFIQSTHNTVAAQIALLLKCHRYNNTYVHRGFSFDHALTDALLLLQDNPCEHILAGSADELTPLTFSVLQRLGFYKQDAVDAGNLYHSGTRGSIAGQGAAFFLLSGHRRPGDLARIEALHLFRAPAHAGAVAQTIHSFLSAQNLAATEIDALITGNNGDAAGDKLYLQLQSTVFSGLPAQPFKHLCGEYPTASSFALWLAANLLYQQKLPAGFINMSLPEKGFNKVLIYNCFQQQYHSLLLLGRAAQ